MRKSVKITLGLTLAAGVFSAGFFGKDISTHASSDWQTSEANKAQAEMQKTASDTTTSLSNGVSTDINSTIDSQVSAEIKKQQDELNQLLQQYYDLKLQGLTDTQQYKDLVAKIDYYKQWAFDNYKQQIDQAFAAQGQ